MTAPLLVCDIPVLSRIQKSPIPDTPGRLPPQPAEPYRYLLQRAAQAG